MSNQFSSFIATPDPSGNNFTIQEPPIGSLLSLHNSSKSLSLEHTSTCNPEIYDGSDSEEEDANEIISSQSTTLSSIICPRTNQIIHNSTNFYQEKQQQLFYEDDDNDDCFDKCPLLKSLATEDPPMIKENFRDLVKSQFDFINEHIESRIYIIKDEFTTKKEDARMTDRPFAKFVSISKNLKKFSLSVNNIIYNNMSKVYGALYLLENGDTYEKNTGDGLGKEKRLRAFKQLVVYLEKNGEFVETMLADNFFPPHFRTLSSARRYRHDFVNRNREILLSSSNQSLMPLNYSLIQQQSNDYNNNQLSTHREINFVPLQEFNLNQYCGDKTYENFMTRFGNAAADVSTIYLNTVNSETKSYIFTSMTKLHFLLQEMKVNSKQMEDRLNIKKRIKENNEKIRKNKKRRISTYYENHSDDDENQILQVNIKKRDDSDSDDDDDFNVNFIHQENY